MSYEIERLREIPLESILESLGGTRCQKDPTRNWDTGVGRITVSESKFYNHDLGIGGGGAIDLTMHVGTMQFKEAVSWLEQISSWPAGVTAFSRTSVGSRSVTTSKKPFGAPGTIKERTGLRDPAPVSNPVLKSVPIPTPVQQNWPTVRDYLVTKRHLDCALVDSLHEAGTIYADRYRNVVFLNSRNTGCELLGTGATSYHGYRGEKAPFLLPAVTGEDGKAAFVEGAIDALSLRVLGFGGQILAFGGQAKGLVEESAEELNKLGVTLYTAFDNDSAGNAMAENLGLALQGEARLERMLPEPGAKDWNDMLRARDFSSVPV